MNPVNPSEMSFRQYRFYDYPSISTVISKYSDEQIEELDKQINETDDFNNNVDLYNSALKNKWSDFLNECCGNVYSIHGKQRKTWVNKLFVQINAPQQRPQTMKTKLKHMVNNFRYNDKDIDVSFNSVQVNYKNAIAIIKTAIEKYNEKDAKLEKKRLMVISKAQEFNINAENFNSFSDFECVVENEARKRYINENYPDGEEIYIDCCDECNTWVIGEYRCSCGNRRIYIECDGNMFDGYCAYPMAN